MLEDILKFARTDILDKEFSTLVFKGGSKKNYSQKTENKKNWPQEKINKQEYKKNNRIRIKNVKQNV